MPPKYFLILFILFSSLFTEAQKFAGIPSGRETPYIQNKAFEQEVLKLINKIRLNHHLEPFVWKEDLARAARYHVQDMAFDNYMEHATYDFKRGQLIKVCDTFDRIERFIELPYLAENISAGKSTAKGTVEGWMKSRGHRKNILNPNLKYLGVGYFYKKNTTYLHYWAQVFGG